MKLIEKYICAKNGDMSTCEDILFFCEKLAFVIDGTTSKVKQKIDGKTGGRFASEVLSTALKEVDLRSAPHEILTYINGILKEKSEDAGFVQGPSAVVVFYNAVRREIVRYGDCNFMIGGKAYHGYKEIDDVLAEKRCLHLQKELTNGKTVEELLVHDTGRELIMPELLKIPEYANKEGKYGFPMLNGGDIIENFTEIFSVEAGSEIVLTSDGYPMVAGTLEKSERYLARVIEEDPLCMGLHKSTKGVAKGQISFDDRSYIRFST